MADNAQNNFILPYDVRFPKLCIRKTIRDNKNLKISFRELKYIDSHSYNSKYAMFTHSLLYCSSFTYILNSCFFHSFILMSSHAIFLFLHTISDSPQEAEQNICGVLLFHLEGEEFTWIHCLKSHPKMFNYTTFMDSCCQ